MQTLLDAAVHPLLLELPEATRMGAQVEALRASGKDVVRLSMEQSPFPVPERMVATLREAAEVKEYAPTRGLPELRRVIAEHVQRRLDVDRLADDVLIGPGSKDLVFLLQVAFRGELVLPTPGWVAQAQHARLLGRPVRLIETPREDGYMLTPAALDRALGALPTAPRLVVLGYPANPTGMSYRTEELRELALVCRKHEVFVLSDEATGELHYKGQHVSLARYYPEGTIIATGLSRWVGAGGWRLGCLVFPERLRRLQDAMTVLATDTYTATSAPIQHAAKAAFDGGSDVEQYLLHVRRILSALSRAVVRRLRTIGAVVPQPVGGFYCFADLSACPRAAAFRTGRELCDALLHETGIALLPGSAFGRPEGERTSRIAFVDFDGRRALDAVKVIPKEQPVDEPFVKRHCARVLDAVEVLTEWLTRPA